MENSVIDRMKNNQGVIVRGKVVLYHDGCWVQPKGEHYLHPENVTKKNHERWYYADVPKSIRTRREPWSSTAVVGGISRRNKGGAFDVRKQFFSLTSKWKRETAMSSISADKIVNIHYLTIIALGMAFKDKVVKLILEDLQKGEEFWHYALKRITEENPVPKGMVSNLSLVQESWLKWGAEKKLI